MYLVSGFIHVIYLICMKLNYLGHFQDIYDIYCRDTYAEPISGASIEQSRMQKLVVTFVRSMMYITLVSWIGPK